MPDSRSTVVVIGGGFSGALVAANLLRQSRVPLRVVIVNRSGPVARGVAYGTRSSRHVLNVPAGRMSAFAWDEDDFLRYAQRHDASVTGGSFVQRRLYGDYLEHALKRAREAAPAGSRLDYVIDEAVDVTALEGGGAVVGTACGRALAAAHVVLALGNYPPADPPLADRGFLSSPRYVRDPWAYGAFDRVPVDAPVLLVGTGLTMVDIALELVSRGATARITALSRRGLLPQPHRANTAPPSYSHLPPDLIAGPPRVVDYLRAVRRHVRKLAAARIDWREVVASLRPVTPRLWQALDARERDRFMRHLRPYWDAHRHRLAPELWESFSEARTAGKVAVTAGRLHTAHERSDGVVVLFTRRGAQQPETMHVGAVVNCTGPSADVRAARDPLIEFLVTRGMAMSETAGLGLRVDSRLALLDGRGRPSPILSLVGPMLKGALWEATAVPELRVHADHVAQRVAADLARRTIPAPSRRRVASATR